MATRVLATIALLIACTTSVEVQELSQHDTSVTGLDSTTEMENAPSCGNVLDWNFANAKVTANNLGGVGPSDSGAKEIRYSGVGNGIDLVLTTSAKYVVNPKEKEFEIDGTTKMANGAGNNGINGKFGQVNVNVNTKVNLKFTLMESGTDTPADVSPDQTVFFSVYDLDTDGAPGYEYLDFTTPVDSYSVTQSSTVKISGTKNRLKARATRKGNNDDNPTDPLSMTQIQKDSAVWIQYKGRNTWSMTFGETKNSKKKGGRNLLFAGRAEGDCPPGPVRPPPGNCHAGIEGVIQGGGRVCCPDTCGGAAFGGPERYWAAPYACGGPSCDKGADGKRNAFRYDNCCVGKPVSGGTSKATIDAPYGIVSQRTFCSWGEGKGGLGEDPPPCINKLTKI